MGRRLVEVHRRCVRRRRRQRTRLLWPALATPGVAWLVLLFVVPFYGVLAVAFGDVDPIFGNAVPVWNPLQWNFTSFGDVLERVVSGELGRVLRAHRSCTSASPLPSAS